MHTEAWQLVHNMGMSKQIRKFSCSYSIISSQTKKVMWTLTVTCAFIKRTEWCVLPRDSKASRYGFNDYRYQTSGAVSKIIDYTMGVQKQDQHCYTRLIRGY